MKQFKVFNLVDMQNSTNIWGFILALHLDLLLDFGGFVDCYYQRVLGGMPTSNIWIELETSFT
jgi:hypothetical protein